MCLKSNIILHSQLFKTMTLHFFKAQIDNTSNILSTHKTATFTQFITFFKKIIFLKINPINIKMKHKR